MEKSPDSAFWVGPQVRGAMEGIFPIFQWSPDTRERLFRQAASGWTTEVIQLRNRMTVVVRFGTLPWSRGLPLDPKVAVAADTTEPLRHTGHPWKSGRCPAAGDRKATVFAPPRQHAQADARPTTNIPGATTSVGSVDPGRHVRQPSISELKKSSEAGDRLYALIDAYTRTLKLHLLWNVFYILCRHNFSLISYGSGGKAPTS